MCNRGARLSTPLCNTAIEGDGDMSGCRCVSVRVDLEVFIHQKRILLKCDLCGRVFRFYSEYIHRLDPKPIDHPPHGPSVSPPRIPDAAARDFSFWRDTGWVFALAIVL